MILDCPSCETRFLVNSSLIPEEGRMVKCAKCAHQWHVMPDGEDGTPQEDTSVDAMPNLPEADAGDDNVDIDFSSMPVPTPEKAVLPAMPMALLSVALFIACVVMALYAFRGSLITSMPGVYAMLGMPDTSGIVLADVAYRERPSKTKKRFVVEGKIMNQSDVAKPIPYLRIAIVDAEGEFVMSKEYEANKVLEPGESYPFKSTDIETSFVDRVDHLIVEIGNGVQLSLRE